MASPAPPWRSLIRLPRADAIAVSILTAIPIIWYGIPALIGRALAPGDDAIQNFPLRVLAGHQLASGHLPVFDPYIWGGAPLLGGWNAGALYPFTFLFAIFPPNAAWALNEIVVYAVAAVGLFAFLRVVSLTTVASALGAATFAFAGAMNVHLAHFGLVAGMSWIPLILLAMVKLSRRPSPTARAGWVAVLGVAGGLSVLAGEPRAIDTVVIVAALYFLWLALRLRREAFDFIVSVGGGTVLAVLLGAVQWLPGAITVSTSQRANDTYALFSSGSLSPRWLLLILVPGLLGGSGSFGTAAWFTSYNLPEVMSYVGLLPVVGAFALLGTFRRRPHLPEWLVWQVVAVVGIILAVGSFTPLGHILSAIPLFGGQRLQSRNIAVTDFALAVLLAYWVDHLLQGHTTENRRFRRVGRHGLTRLLALLPLAAAGILGTLALIGPVTVAHDLGASGSRISHALQQRPVFAVTLVLVIASAVIVLVVGRLAPGRRALVLVVFVLVDLLAFNATDVWNIAPGFGEKADAAPRSYAPGTSAATFTPAPGLGQSGRFAMYDPNGVIDYPLRALNSPDLNVPAALLSVQGYSSIVYGPYAEATGSHAAEGKGYNALSPAAVGSGLLNQLDTTTLLTSPTYLVRPSDAAAFRGPSSTPTVAPTGPGTRAVPSEGSARWDFGESVEVARVSVPWVAGDGGAPGSWRLFLVQRDGSLTAEPVAVTEEPSGGFVLTLSHPASGVGLDLRRAGGAGTAGPPVIATGVGTFFVVNGPLGDALLSRWVFEGDSGPIAYFSNPHAAAPLRLRPVGAASGTGTVRPLNGPTVEPTEAAVSTPHGAQLIRAVAMIPGWTARWSPATGGASIPLTVRRTGLVQSVEVPAGRGTVTWYYRAPGLEAGLIMTLAGVLVLLGLMGTVLLARRARLPDQEDARLRMARERVPNL